MSRERPRQGLLLGVNKMIRFLEKQRLGQERVTDRTALKNWAQASARSKNATAISMAYGDLNMQLTRKASLSVDFSSIGRTLCAVLHHRMETQRVAASNKRELTT